VANWTRRLARYPSAETKSASGRSRAREAKATSISWLVLALRRWVRAREWPAQVVLVLMIVTVCYVALVFWLLVGAGVAPWVA
jgi:hypothetical protein